MFRCFFLNNSVKCLNQDSGKITSLINLSLILCITKRIYVFIQTINISYFCTDGINRVSISGILSAIPYLNLCILTVIYTKIYKHTYIDLYT